MTEKSVLTLEQTVGNILDIADRAAPDGPRDRAARAAIMHLARELQEHILTCQPRPRPPQPRSEYESDIQPNWLRGMDSAKAARKTIDDFVKRYEPTSHDEQAALDHLHKVVARPHPSEFWDGVDAQEARASVMLDGETQS